MHKTIFVTRVFFTLSLCFFLLLTGCAAKETGFFQTIPEPYHKQFENTALVYRLCIQDNIAKTDDFTAELFATAILVETKCQHLSAKLQKILQEYGSGMDD